MKSFEIYENSVGFAGRIPPGNGDHTGHIVLEDENLVVMVVADGVGEHSCDWAASETTVRSVLERFQETDGDLDLRMVRAVEFAHQEVQNLRGESAGAISTVVFVVWEFGAAECRYLSVGDSRVYRVVPGSVVQLTMDDSTSRPVKLEGEIVIKDGAAAFSHAITAAVGTPEPLDLQVKMTEFNSGEMMVLTSDGCHELAGFLGYLREVYDRPDLKKAAEGIIFVANEAYGRDDTSVILLRRTDYDERDQEKCVRALRAGEDFRAAGLSGHFMVRMLADHMTEAAQIPQAEIMGRVLDYMKEQGLKFTRPDVSRIIENLKDDRRIETKRIWDRLVEMLQGV